MNSDTKKTLSHLLVQVAKLLGIVNGNVRVDYHDGQPKVIEPTPVIRMGDPKG